jgi:sortase A
MKIVYKLSKEMITLIAGLILLIGGIVGGIWLFKTGVSEDSSKIAYFQTETAMVGIPQLLTPTSVVATTSAGTTEVASTPAPKGLFLNFESYFVHAAPGSGLEDPAIPDRIVIPAIGLDAPVIVAEFNYTQIEGETFGQWLAPNEYAAGWHPNSALLGKPGNTVINGHHNEYGKVFEKIVDLQVGDEIDVYSKGRKFAYVVANPPMKLLELYQNVETRLNNARWLAHTDDERLTLVTCWPPLSNTYRVIVVARPKQ